MPTGSVKKGEELVLRGGAGKTVACAACHGEGLKGNGNFPPLAGRSPSYLARQLYDMQHCRHYGTQLMRMVAKLMKRTSWTSGRAYSASRSSRSGGTSFCVASLAESRDRKTRSGDL